jgi:hypothetical protein
MLLFHSVLGPRRGVALLAASLRERGHVVHTPDLYDGETFSDYESGMAKSDALGDELTASARCSTGSTEPTLRRSSGNR